MQDYRLQDGDIVISDNDLAFTESVAQRLTQKLRLWRGEWFLDRQAGFPYLQQVLGQRPRPEVVSSLLRQTITNDPDVRDVANIDLMYDDAARELSASFRAVLIDGTEQTIEVAL